jgi:hypothetical protein
MSGGALPGVIKSGTPEELAPGELLPLQPPKARVSERHSQVNRLNRNIPGNLLKRKRGHNVDDVNEMKLLLKVSLVFWWVASPSSTSLTPQRRGEVPIAGASGLWGD